MRTSGDVYGSDAGSSRSEEERASRVEDDSNPRPKSSNHDSDSSPIKYTDKQQAELLKKLDSIKGHLLRGGGNDNNNTKKDSEQQPPMGFHGGPPYYNPYPYGMYPYGVPIQNWYPGQQLHYPNQIQMQPRPPPYPQGQYVDIGSDILDSQLQDPRFFPGTPSRYGGDVPVSPVSHHGEKLGPFSPHGGGGGGQGHHYTRWPSEVSSETGGGAFARGYVRQAVSDHDSRRCHPLAGGAPFVACHSCFELLYLPKRKLLAQQKLKCGACSEVISFTISDNKKLVFSSSGVSVEVEDRSDCPEETKFVQAVSASEHSDDEERSSISSEPQKEVVVKSVRRRDKGAKAPPAPRPHRPAPPPEKSNLLELFEYSNVHRAAVTYGMAQLGYNKQESYAQQDSVKAESVATETDVSYNGYYDNTEVSEEDSRVLQASKEESRPRNRKESGSSDYSFSEVTSEIISDEQFEVWVNGHLIPENLVITAEKQAGPVQAGKYWYDYRAGFWGVMGNPCLGIIPPFIEEFSRPMPDNCGAGNSGVFVNGRELHERDLELLSRRGLPRDKNRSYIVDISGRVLDGDSGEELKSLGKLAPTIEKVKHGFGMRVPRSLASSA